MDIRKTMGDFKIPQFTLLTSPEQDEIVRQRGAEAEREREAQILARKKQAFENSGVPKRYWNESFNTWNTRNKDDEVRLQTVIDYSRQKSNDSVLLLLGPKEVGKTHLGASIIREAGGTFISIEEMTFQYEGSTDYHAKINRVDLMNFYSTTPMLVIDEIGRSMQQAKEDSILNTLQKINQTRMSSGPDAVLTSALRKANSNTTKKPTAPSLNRQIRTTSKAITRNAW